MPEGEDLSLKDTEQRELIAFAARHVKGRVPLIAHVSDAGTMIAVERARYAASCGVDALVTHPPYFWHPKPSMVVEHIVAVGKAVKLPVFVCTPPVENVGTHLTADMFMQLVDRLPNLCGVVDAGMDFVFMEEIMGERRARKAGADRSEPGTSRSTQRGRSPYVSSSAARMRSSTAGVSRVSASRRRFATKCPRSPRSIQSSSGVSFTGWTASNTNAAPSRT